jgi:chemotaxis signal transduction protein
VDQILEVIDDFEVLSAPGSHRAVLGVTPSRDRLVPLVHLAALIESTDPPEERGDAAVLARCSGSLVAFEVDDAEELVLEAPVPVPDAWQLPWASGVVRHRGELIPIIDLDILAERLMPDDAEIAGDHG